MNFRKVIAVIRPEKLKEVEKVLIRLNVSGITVTKVKGFGEHISFFKPDWLFTHARIEVFIHQEHAEKVANTIIDVAHSGREGDGIVAVLPVESAYQIRTKEKCHKKIC